MYMTECMRTAQVLNCGWHKLISNKKKYHSGAFVGNDCIKMLKNVDRLQQIAEFHNMHIIKKYVHILRCLYDVYYVVL